VSGDRIRHELDLIFVEERVLAMLDRLQELGIFEYIHPELCWDEWIRERSLRLWLIDPLEFGIDLEPVDAVARRDLFYLFLLCRLDENSLHTILERLKLPSSLRKKVRDANRLWAIKDQFSQMDQLTAVAQFDGVDPTVAYGLGLMEDEDSKMVPLIKFYFTKWIKTKCYTDGRLLKQMGISPGPLYRQILNELKLAWIEGRIKSEQEEMELLSEMIKSVV
jgi:tRNA nucleotidyltransferase (CCA-adding enzyme)